MKGLAYFKLLKSDYFYVNSFVKYKSLTYIMISRF